MCVSFPWKIKQSLSSTIWWWYLHHEQPAYTNCNCKSFYCYRTSLHSDSKEMNINIICKLITTTKLKLSQCWNSLLYPKVAKKRSNKLWMTVKNIIYQCLNYLNISKSCNLVRAQVFFLHIWLYHYMQLTSLSVF